MNFGYAIVTGGSGGIGREVARLLSAAGLTVEVWGRHKENLEAVVAEGWAQLWRQVDVGESSQVAQAFESSGLTGDERGVVVHSAGIWTPGSLIELEDDVIERHVRTVTLGTAFVLRGAVKALTSSGGHIVDVVAASAKSGFGDTALNTMAKRACDGLHEGLRAEIAGTDVRLTAILPDEVAPPESAEVAAGTAMSYGDIASAVVSVLQLSPRMFVDEVLLTAPRSTRGAG